MNILFTCNKNYLPHVIEVLRSINDTNHTTINIYIISDDITKSDIDIYASYLLPQNHIFLINVNDTILKDAPISKRYPKAVYYRLLAGNLLPIDIDRILYLDPDVIVKGNLDSLYQLEMNDFLFAGATTIKKALLFLNDIKNGAELNNKYINTGVLLMNLSEIRKYVKADDIYNYINKHKATLTLPDQDIMNALYGDKIILIDNLIYNLSDRAITFHNIDIANANHQIDESWVEKNAIIIHYYGKNKPWNKKYKGILQKYYLKYQINNG